MKEGVLHQPETPTELRNTIQAKRLELRTEHLGKAEAMLQLQAGEGQEIIDVQRFGDRLDLLVADPERAAPIVEDHLRAANLDFSEIKMDERPLENMFVAALRSLGQEIRSHDFASDYNHNNLRGQIAIGATGLTKEFGSFTAVKDVSVQIRYGEVYGLLGANGAGKTTTIKMLCGLLPPTSGQMRLPGGSGRLRSQLVRQLIGNMSQGFSSYNDLSTQENLDFFAGVNGVPD